MCKIQSGTNIKAKSLQIFREKYHPNLSLRYSMRPVECNQGLLNLLIYLAGIENDLICQHSSLEKLDRIITHMRL